MGLFLCRRRLSEPSVERSRAAIVCHRLSFQWVSLHYTVHLGLPCLTQGDPEGRSESVLISVQTQPNLVGSGLKTSQSSVSGFSVGSTTWTWVPGNIRVLFLRQ